MDIPLRRYQGGDLMSRFPSSILRTIAALLLAAASALSAAQEIYPSRPIRFISSGSPGTALDILSRLYADKFSQRLGHQAVVENRGGAGGTIASQAVAKAAPDGYTLLIVNNAHAINPTLYGSLPYDTLKDFTGVALLADSPAVVAASPEFGVKTLQELIVRAKRKPGTINYGSGGIGTSVHIVSEYLASQAGITLAHVPYKQMGELNSDLLSGRIQIVLGPVAFHLPHIRAGRHVAIAVTSSERIPLLPDVPTVAEAGIPGFEYGTWYGLIAPAGTPKPILDLLAREIVHANDQPDVRERMGGQGLVPKRMVLGDFDAFIRSEIEKLGRIVKASGAKAN
jgi:tripartite-type tricarboxylate transporter receptor subunit TctC